MHYHNHHQLDRDIMAVEVVERDRRPIDRYERQSKQPSHSSRHSSQTRSRSAPRDRQLRSSTNSRGEQTFRSSITRDEEMMMMHQARPRRAREPPEDDPDCPFDVNGFCILHKDVRMAKRRGNEWNVKLENCPKCNNMNTRRQLSGETASMTSDGSRFQTHSRQHQQGRSSERARQNSFHSQGPRQQTRGRNNQNMTRRRSRSSGNPVRSSYQSSPDQYTDNERDYRDRSPHMRNIRRRDQNRRAQRSGSPVQQRRSLSHSSRRSRADRRPSDHIKVKRTVCVDGRPFDKNGRCFVHPHCKLASKKILGGWKIHMEFCPLCLEHAEDDDDQSVISGLSRLTDESGYSDTSYRSSRMRGSGASVCSRKSNASFRSFGSTRSTSTWSTNRSSKKHVKSKDDSFLPLDQEGYCIHHPDVQLAKISKKGGWRVLMDICPECAEESLTIGGNSVASSRRSRRGGSVASGNSSCRSGSSHSTFIESMPYIDGDGKPGHYTGHVDSEGQPNGQGKMKYLDGSKFAGVWHEGTKLHGRTSKKSSSGSSTKKTVSQQNTPPPPPPPPFQAKKRSKPKNKQVPENEAIHRISRRDVPGRDVEKREQRRSLSRPRLACLRRKCDEIESLLKGYPTSPT